MKINNETVTVSHTSVNNIHATTFLGQCSKSLVTLNQNLATEENSLVQQYSK